MLLIYLNCAIRLFLSASIARTSYTTEVSRLEVKERKKCVVTDASG